MKYQHALILAILLFLPESCETFTVPEGADPVTPSLLVLTPTNITETGFQLNWSLSTALGFQTIAVDLSKDKDMGHIIKHLESGDISQQYIQVTDLQGATPYFYKISLLEYGSPVFTSEIKKVETLYKMDPVDLTTEDAYNLSGRLAYLESLSGSRPGIILMHEFGVWVNPWIGSELLKQLVAEGYVCLTFFFRGHGTSSPVEDLMDLVNDKSLLTKDLQAAIDFMNAHELVDSGKLGLVGGSMGASLALAGNGYDEVQTSVALSPAQDGVFLIFPDMTLTSVYYLVAELDIHEDPAVNFPAETQTLYEMTDDPRKLDIILGTADHGSNLLSRDSLNASIRDWILERVPLD
jgi:dienelactone hydrolase